MVKKKFLNDLERDFPAKYSDALMPFLAELLEGYERILDPFAGTGKIRSVRPDAYLLELEPEWAAIQGATVGDAHALPWPADYFDAVVTSPTYGNRMADHHEAKDVSKRNTYTHTLGRQLSANNSGKLQWGKEYRVFHYKAWQEIWRVLRPGGRFVLNVSDHIRKGKIIPVCRFHELLCSLTGFDLVKYYHIETPRQRQGENGKLRVGFEKIFIFEKPKPRQFSPYLISWASNYWPTLADLPDGNDPFPDYPISGVPDENQ